MYQVQPKGKQVVRKREKEGKRKRERKREREKERERERERGEREGIMIHNVQGYRKHCI